MTAPILGLRDAGPRALLLEFDGLDDVLAHHQHLSRHPLPGQREAVAAARTLLLRFDAPGATREARHALGGLTVAAFSAEDSQVVELEVVYDGEDLAEVAGRVGMSVDALIAWHTGTEFTGAFGGFAPGFTYCVPVDPTSALEVPRRDTPRTAVPAGSVALAGEFSAVYPRVSPGGWQLIGRTPARMWDLDREQQGESPALVRPGDVVRHRAVRDAARVSTPAPAAGPAPAEVPEVALEVLDPGLQTLIQDLGREGLSDLGVSRAGAADESAMRQANRLVGTAAEAPVLEVLHGGLRLRAAQSLVLAVAGAEVPVSVTDADGGTRTPGMREPFLLTTGDTVHLDTPRRGLRTVVAVRGGFAAERVLGSASADTMSGLGPAPLQAGDRLGVADAVVAPVGEPEPTTLPEAEPDGAIPLRFTRGPRDDWFAEEEIHRLQSQRWRVTPESNRIGIRLGLPAATEGGGEDSGEEGVKPRPLERVRDGELPSEGVPRGSLQMPPAGLPVLFLNDHPVTGGYPVIGVVIDEDLPVAAQLAPGDVVALRAVDPLSLEPADAALTATALTATVPADTRPAHRTPFTCEDPA
ncbi:5-oxoprolinase subunit B/C family protein [Nesterenkonia sp. K-15-9-6]|uniref:5-oxoprolinase subunit B/C family protein n=1 Tax=Nesterenkonia sp. K-15-9-6 TaxID=3093918 RepID=UPI0040440C74